jgi:hypothetical protein
LLVSAQAAREERSTRWKWIATGAALAALIVALVFWWTRPPEAAVVEAITRYLEGDIEAMMEYENWTVESFRSYLSVRSQFYGSIQRWRGSLFWERRGAANLARSQLPASGNR